MRLYVNGVEVASQPGSAGDMTLSNMGIGGVLDSPFGGRYFAGMIDDLTAWDEELDADSIALICAGGLQGINGPTSLNGPAPAGTLFIIR